MHSHAQRLVLILLLGGFIWSVGSCGTTTPEEQPKTEQMQQDGASVEHPGELNPRDGTALCGGFESPQDTNGQPLTTELKTDLDQNIDGVIVITWNMPCRFLSQLQGFKVTRSRTDGSFPIDVIAELSSSEGREDNGGVVTFQIKDTNVLPGGMYETPFYYGVSAVALNGQTTPISKVLEAKSINANQPSEVQDIKVQGSNLQDGPEMLIRWTANAEFDIQGYYVFRSERDAPISTNDPSNAVSRLISHRDGKTLSFVDTNIIEGQPYWYVVVAVDKGDAQGRPALNSRFQGLVPAKAKLLSPEDGATVKPDAFQWSAAPGVQSYVVVVNTSPEIGSTYWRSKPTTTTQATYDGPALAPGTKYYWFVYGYTNPPKSNEEPGNSRSDLRSFQTP